MQKWAITRQERIETSTIPPSLSIALFNLLRCMSARKGVGISCMEIENSNQLELLSN